MYLKNASTTKSIVINTVVGKIGIKPQEIIELDSKYRVLPPVSENLQEVSQEEYLCFRQGTKPVVQEVVETIIEQDNDKDGDVQQEDITIVNEEVTNENVADFVKNLLTAYKPADAVVEEVKEPEEIDTTPKEALVVEEKDGNEEIAFLESQLDELKESWKEAKTPRKKDKIYKQMKEIQKQLEKITKDINS